MIKMFEENDFSGIYDDDGTQIKLELIKNILFV